MTGLCQTIQSEARVLVLGRQPGCLCWELTWLTRPWFLGATGSGAACVGPTSCLAAEPPAHSLQPGSGCTAHQCLLGRWVKTQLIPLPAGFGLEHFPRIQPGRCVFPISSLTPALRAVALSLWVLQHAEGGAW